MTRHNQAKALLNSRLEDLKSRVADIDHLLQEPLSADFEEQAGDLEGQDSLPAMEVSARREIKSILAALNRIKLGTYGVCVDCGAEIPAKRLEAVPTALRCIECESKRSA